VWVGAKKTAQSRFLRQKEAIPLPNRTKMYDDFEVVVLKANWLSSKTYPLGYEKKNSLINFARGAGLEGNSAAARRFGSVGIERLCAETAKLSANARGEKRRS
jgi:hypothetical protein